MREMENMQQEEEEEEPDDDRDDERMNMDGEIKFPEGPIPN